MSSLPSAIPSSIGAPAPTHLVENQAPPLVDVDLYSSDRALVEALHREGGGHAEEKLVAFGKTMGSREVIDWGFQANRFPPLLKTHDRYGHRIDEVEFHPAWHQLMQLSYRNGLHSAPWRDPQKGAHVARGALSLIAGQIECGVGCPITMTFGAVPTLRKQPELAAAWLPKLFSLEYDPRLAPLAEKKGVLIGMAMTEKQGGSDVRANTTRAVAVGRTGPGEEYLLTGHKWFCSAPMCDAFLVLAQTDRGLSCFLLPRVLPDGTRNRFHLQRLKDKLGNRSNASSEVEFAGASARMVGDEGRGVPTILEMATHTRLDCGIGSAALMRQAVAQALHHCAHRRAFGQLLIDQPLMQNVLADLAVESEAATVLMMRLCRAYDAQDDKVHEGPFRRLATALAKYWVCKRAPSVVGEALECHGGNGYVEESILPRLYRESPLNSLWEGSGNVICLDVLRALSKEPQSYLAFQRELDGARGLDARYDRYVDALAAELSDLRDVERKARRIVERMALSLQGALLLRHAPEPIKEAFLATRLDGDAGKSFGTLPSTIDTRAIIDRARPVEA